MTRPILNQSYENNLPSQKGKILNGKIHVRNNQHVKCARLWDSNYILIRKQHYHLRNCFQISVPHTTINKPLSDEAVSLIRFTFAMTVQMLHLGRVSVVKYSQSFIAN